MRISSLDTETWFPAIGYFDGYLAIDGKRATRGDWIGYAFAPLIRIELAYVHPSHRVLDENGFFMKASPP